MARSFTSSGDKITYGTVSPPLTGTVHAWYYPTWNTTTEANPRMVARTYRVSTLGLFDFCTYNGSGDGNSCYFGWYNSDASYVDSRYKIPAASIVTQNAWTSLAMTWVSTGATLVYSNGSNATSGGSYVAGSANCSSFDISGNTNTLGNNPGDGSHYAGGSLAEYAIWNVVLSAAELSSLAAGVSPEFIRPASLTVYIPILGQSTEPNYRSGSAGTVTGTTSSAHPRVYKPYGLLQLGIPYVAPPAGGYFNRYFYEQHIARGSW